MANAEGMPVTLTAGRAAEEVGEDDRIPYLLGTRHKGHVHSKMGGF